MRSSQKSLPSLSLARTVYGFVGVCLVALVAVVWLMLSERSSDVVAKAVDMAVRVRTDSAGQQLARALHDDWLALEGVARMARSRSPADMAAVMDGIQGSGARVSWIGLADTAGIVRVASGDLLQGQDVSARPWFRGGLQDAFAGDVHEAVLLADLLPPRDDGTPPRFIDLARPVRDAAGEVTGVLGMHIDAAWVQRFLDETAETLKIDLFLVSADGTLLLATDATVPGTDELAVLRAARAGVAGGGAETWPDGRDYVSSLVPSVTYGDLPSFGWRMVGRLEADLLTPALRQVGWVTALTGLAALSLLAALTALFVVLFVRPISALARTAERIADGDEVFPPERGITRETAQLSAALARLQQDRDDRLSSDRS